MNGQQTSGNEPVNSDASPNEAQLKEALKQLKLLHIKVSVPLHARDCDGQAANIIDISLAC